MYNTKRISASLVLLAALTAFAPLALAMGLGNISVESYLNQPLQARIDLITRADDDLASVTVGMASADDFKLIGASRDAISVPLSFALEQKDGGASILVTSKLPLKDPIVRLIVEVNWASGRLLREYTMFLDPPSFTSPAPSPVVDERGRPPVAPAPAEAEWVPAGKATAREDASGQSKPNATTPVTAGGNEYGPVQSGDTLWRIAADWSHGTGLDMNAVMLAIQRNNPQAFIKDNINLLKKGAILRMPQVEEVRQVPVATAREEVVQQYDAYSQNIAPTAAETPLLDMNSRQPATPEGSASTTAPADKLELVPPADKADVASAGGTNEAAAGSSASPAEQALKEELARKEEELVVEQQQNQYLQDQITELRDRLGSSQEGNVADAGLSQMEEELRQKRLSEGKDEGSESPAGQAAQATAKKPSQKTSQTAVPKVTTKAASKPEKAWYSSLTLWLLVLLVVAAAVAGWLINRRNAGQDWDLESAGPEGGTVREIKDEAEEILKVLKPQPEPAADKEAAEEEGEAVTAPEPQQQTRRERAAQSDEAELLDEDSADPEVRLDLARAYIAMGDREAARVILDEVIEHGSEEQQSEAKKMLGEL